MLNKEQRTPLRNAILIALAGVTVLHLLGEFLNYESFSSWTKPILLPVLLIYFISETRKAAVSNKKIIILVVGALLFSFFGDVLLMFVKVNPIYFIIGLGAFLIAHLFYILSFRQIQQNSKTTFSINYIIIALAILYYVSFIGLIYGNLEGSLRIPVMCYGVMITVMLVYSFAIKKYLPRPYSNLLVLGTILFVLSDSLIAVNKFYTPLPIAGFLIMSTYITAQFLIVRSMISYLRT